MKLVKVVLSYESETSHGTIESYTTYPDYWLLAKLLERFTKQPREQDDE